MHLREPLPFMVFELDLKFNRRNWRGTRDDYLQHETQCDAAYVNFVVSNFIETCRWLLLRLQHVFNNHQRGLVMGQGLLGHKGKQVHKCV